MSIRGQLLWHLCRTKLPRKVLNSKTKSETKCETKTSKNAPKRPRKSLSPVQSAHIFCCFFPHFLQFRTGNLKHIFKLFFSQRESAGMVMLRTRGSWAGPQKTQSQPLSLVLFAFSVIVASVCKESPCFLIVLFALRFGLNAGFHQETIALAGLLGKAAEFAQGNKDLLACMQVLFACMRAFA